MQEPRTGFDSEELFEFRFDRCLITLTQGRDGLRAGHTAWAA
jgi:hypothetical protein